MEPLASLSVHELLQRTAAKTPAPGGGAVACVTGALAASLAQMVVSYSLGKKSLAAHEPDLKKADAVLTNARTILLQLGDEDAEAYSAVNELMRLPETDARRKSEWPAAVARSVQVPRAALAACMNTLRLMESLAPITNRHLRSDLGIAAVLADAAVKSCVWNIDINTASLADPAERARVTDETRRLSAEAGAARARTEKACAA